MTTHSSRNPAGRGGLSKRPRNFRPDSAYRPAHRDGLDVSDSNALWTMTHDEDGEYMPQDEPDELHFPSKPPDRPATRYREEAAD